MEIKDGGICPQCERGRLFYNIRDVAFDYKGELRTFRKVDLLSCSLVACGWEGFANKEKAKYIEKELTKFRKKVNKRNG